MAVLFISSELPEIVGVCDRVLVMREGEITGEVGGETGVEITQQNIMKFATDVVGVHQPMATEATIDTSALAAAKRKEFVRTTIELAGMLPVLLLSASSSPF